MKVLFIRHGKTEWNNLKKMQGSVDIPLNEEGIMHAKEMAKKIKDIDIDIAFSSPLDRAKQTMEIINSARESKIPVIYEEALSERDYGLYEGRNKALFDYNFMWDYSNPSNIDNFFHFAWPIIKFVYENLLRAYKNKTVLIVAHGGVSKIFEMLLSKDSLYPNEVADFLPNNSEIITYKNINNNNFVFNTSSEDRKSKRDKNKIFQILTPNMISLYFPNYNIENLIDTNKISKHPKIRYRASIIFRKDDGTIATEMYSNTNECKFPARTIDPTNNILNQVRDILLMTTGYIGDISDFSNIGETIEIRPSDPVSEIVFSQIYYISKATLVAEPLPAPKDEAEGFNISFCKPEKIIELLDQSLLESEGLKGEFYRPLITKKSIALRDKLIFEFWNNKINQK